MLRKLAVITGLLAASVGTRAAMAQAAPATQKSTAAPAAKPAPAVTAKVDTGVKTAKTTAKPSATPTTRHAAWTKDQIKEAQEGLAKAGLYKGKVTGVMNAGTKKALRAYQKQEKLPVTGRLSDDVLAKLKSA